MPNLEDAMGQLKDRVAAVEFDMGGQLLAFRQQLLIERRLADDRHEAQMKRFDALDSAIHSLDSAIHSIAMKLSTNGTGGAHV